MSRRRRGHGSSLNVLILLILFFALWYLGVIPQLPPLSSLIPQAGQLGTVLPQFRTAPPPATSAASTAPSNSSEELGKRTKTSGCVSSNALPDPACTPGGVFASATTQQICTIGYTSQVRNVSSAVKSQVYSEYGIASHEPGQYEVDHLIPLELGGSNSIANLWPEPASPSPGFHEKDQVEDYLHQQVCDGKISLPEAQARIAHDWLTVYETMPK